MRTRYFLIVTAAVEVGAGLALAIAPAVSVGLLLGSTPLASEVPIVGRITGAALITLGVASWLARDDERSPAARGLIVALLFYNAAAVAILAHTGFVSERVGFILWPGVILHTALAAWCIDCLTARPRTP